MNIRQRITAAGRVTWQVDFGMVNGRRDQRSFKLKGDAEAALEARQELLRKSGTNALQLSDADRIRFLEARERLAAAGATIDQAVDFYLRHHAVSERGLTFEDLFERCLLAKEERGLSDRYVRGLRSSVGSFVKAGFGCYEAAQITAKDIEGWLKGNEWAWKTWNNYRIDVATVFAWGIEKELISMNPAQGVPTKKKPGKDDDEVSFLTVEQVQQMLVRAATPMVGGKVRKEDGTWEKKSLEDEDFRDCLAVAVIGFFCGLRADKELGWMHWDDVREDVVIVSSGRAKSRQRRAVDLPENARAWLKLCPVKEGPILPKNFTRKWRRLRQVCKVMHLWTRSIVRHTFATMHMAHFKDEKLLQVLLGHEDAKLIYAHYRGVETAANGKRYWEMMPPPHLLVS